MPQYVLIGTHAPSHCPGANGTMREVFGKLMSAAPTVGQKHNVKPVVGPLHLDPAHKILVIAEAPSAEAVRDFLRESRLAEVQDMELYLTTPMDALLQSALPPLY